MAITALEIKDKTFGTKMFGYNTQEVEEFLDIISGEKSESTYITSLDRSLQSHYCALAAEYSRLHDGKPVDIETFR